MMDAFKKREVALKYYLLGREYTAALIALNFAAGHHIGLRKDGVTPEFQHQLEIALHIVTLSLPLELEENCIIAALLHDVQEDHAVESATIAAKFGPEIKEAVWLLTVKFEGYRKNANEYYTQIADNQIAAIVKGCDRVHNLNSMHGVFVDTKKASYIDEVVEHFIPMLKRAADNFPHLHQPLMNIRQTLKMIVKHVSVMLEATPTPERE